MSQVVECVPNFSEGRNSEIVAALAGVVRSVPGVVLLDETKDPDDPHYGKYHKMKDLLLEYGAMRYKDVVASKLEPEL